jgi:O-antigen ligase
MYLLDQLRKYIWIIAIVLVYVAADMFLTFREIYYLNLLPIVLIIVFLASIRLDILFFVIICCTPLSIPFIEFVRSSPIDFYIPTEPMLFGVMLLVIFKMIRKGEIDKKVLNHPVTYAILFNVFWIFITSITSCMPLVSFKFLLARIWFLTTFYFLAIHIFRNTKNLSVFVWCYTIPMLFVITYAIMRHLSFGLYDKQAAHIVMNPFFRDHTSYGAILAMIFFSIGGIILKRKASLLVRTLYWLTLAYITAGLILSYTRAAWISVLCSFCILIVTLLRIKFRYVFLVVILAIIYVASERLEILHRLEKNRQSSSADIAEHVQSISNITTDDSNLERLNRWTAALRMFRERPVFGWGPGTYMFQYAPFQLSSKKTIISTDFGDLGNAHSEYIGPLCESGVLGSLSFITIVIVALLTGFKVYNRIEDRQLKQIVLAFILALITYLIHGSLNNFLDTDKASALFWGLIAAFVSLDLFYLPEQEKRLQTSIN